MICMIMSLVRSQQMRRLELSANLVLVAGLVPVCCDENG
jgi:hypothetical protein